MTVRDIIKLVCEFVGEKEILAKLCQEDEDSLFEPFSNRESEKLRIMTNNFNMVNQEIASDYIPFLHREAVSGLENTLFFNQLEKQIVNVYEIKNRFGTNLQFKLFPNHVEFNGTAKYITYNYLPEELKLNEEVPVVLGLSARIYAYGVASEFLLVDGMSEDAEIWEERFKQSLFVLGRKKGEHTLPKRRWL